MPLAGYWQRAVTCPIVAVIAAGTVGSLIGTLPWYVLGRRLGHEGVCRLAERRGRWLTMSPEDVDVAAERFKSHGRTSVLVGRLIPTIRTLISVPAGVKKMPLFEFLIFSIDRNVDLNDRSGDGGLHSWTGLRSGGRLRRSCIRCSHHSGVLVRLPRRDVHETEVIGVPLVEAAWSHRQATIEPYGICWSNIYSPGEPSP